MTVAAEKTLIKKRGKEKVGVVLFVFLKAYAYRITFEG